MDDETKSTLDILNEKEVRDLVVDMCSVLVEHGIVELHVGGLMRLLGISEEQAQEHDDEIMLLDSVEKFQQAQAETQIPPGTTIH